MAQATTGQVVLYFSLSDHSHLCCVGRVKQASASYISNDKVNVAIAASYHQIHTKPEIRLKTKSWRYTLDSNGQLMPPQQVNNEGNVRQSPQLHRVWFRKEKMQHDLLPSEN